MPDSLITQIVCQRIKARLDAVGIDMKSASLAAGLNESAVRDILNRRQKLGPTITTLQALTVPLKCSLGYLVGVEGEEPRP
jgi:lambda repressor-like predicted transcriptional regulator